MANEPFRKRILEQIKDHFTLINLKEALEVCLMKNCMMRGFMMHYLGFIEKLALLTFRISTRNSIQDCDHLKL